MTGKTVLLTGFTSGVGEAAAWELAARGADLVLLCRNADKGRSVIQAIQEAHPNARLDLLVADLGSQAAIPKAAEEFNSLGRSLHVLFNNAGLVNSRRQLSADGLEATFAVNHLGPFLLTNLLRPALRESAPSRVVFTGSDAYRFAGRTLDFDDLQSENGYRAFSAYGRSKLGNLLFAREFARREIDHGVTANVFHPGFVATALGVNDRPAAGFMTRLISPLARSPAKGAETGIYLSTDPAFDQETGGYYFNCRPRSTSSYSKRPEIAARLWERSAELCELQE